MMMEELTYFQAHLKLEIEVFLNLKELSWLKIWFPEIRSQDVSLSLLVVVFEFCCDFDVNTQCELLL